MRRTDSDADGRELPEARRRQLAPPEPPRDPAETQESREARAYHEAQAEVARLRERLDEARTRLADAEHELDAAARHFPGADRTELRGEDRVIGWVDEQLARTREVVPGRPDPWHERGTALESAAREYVRARDAVAQCEERLAHAEARAEQLPEPPAPESTGPEIVESEFGVFYEHRYGGDEDHGVHAWVNSSGVL
ncbi:hypothetical protein ACW9HQ_47210, partial [Nocardia gipuzkoensis]